ncbi:MAG: hypothetical protein ACLFQX_11350 [Candidatus Kapaibacterium sp.]
MKRLFIYIALLISPIAALAQGFDWQYSARVPTGSPTLFIGINPEISFINHGGDFDFLERETTCCTYESGSGTGFRLGLAAEQWLTPDLAAGLRFSISASNARFTSRQSVPLNPQTLLVTEYSFESEIIYFNGVINARRRIAGTHFSAGALLEIGFAMQTTNLFSESIISPDYEYFNTSPPSQTREIPLGHVPSTLPIAFSPGIMAGWDFTFGRGLYATIYSSAKFNAFNVITEERWRRWSVGIGINIYKGIR